MTSGRPYRGNELSLEDALVELRQNAGSQFDERVVAAVEEAVRCGDLYLMPRNTGQFAAVTGGAKIGLL
jgi:HD-GYP domain-containing protein (c-di-GMP phosphodiesterase class II)